MLIWVWKILKKTENLQKWLKYLFGAMYVCHLSFIRIILTVCYLQSWILNFSTTSSGISSMSVVCCLPGLECWALHKYWPTFLKIFFIKHYIHTYIHTTLQSGLRPIFSGHLCSECLKSTLNSRFVEKIFFSSLFTLRVFVRNVLRRSCRRKIFLRLFLLEMLDNLVFESFLPSATTKTL